MTHTWWVASRPLTIRRRPRWDGSTCGEVAQLAHDHFLALLLRDGVVR